MARFKGYLHGQHGGHATRLGDLDSGILAEAMNERVGVRVVGRVVEPDAASDVFDVWVTNGRPGTSATLLGHVRLVDGRPVFTTAIGIYVDGAGRARL